MLDSGQRIILVFILFFYVCNLAYGQKQVLNTSMHHLRIGEKPEWATFPQQPEDGQLVIHFNAQANTTEKTLSLRQHDVKQEWQVLMNEHEIGNLARDENGMIIYLPIFPGVLKSGNNILRIVPKDTISDDILVGQLVLEDRPVNQVLSEATLHIEVNERESGKLLPVRITIANPEGILQSVGANSEKHLAFRPGFIYTGNGRATFGLPAGQYTLYAGRGFEYSVDSVQLVVQPGDTIHQKLTIQREVPTEGWISSDTHIHTFTHSGHGDASIEERVLTIAGEGIELPIITDHNIHVDIEPVAKTMEVDTYFTSVIGNEVTTPVGHFNIFPIAAGAPVPNHQVKSWDEVSKNIKGTPMVKAIILNHARDLHSGFRPFGVRHHLSEAGLNLEGWVFPANAMEVINSGAQQTDMMRLFQDWFGMLNRGHLLTPVGASDSHDVGRYLVGQARTYIRYQDKDPNDIDVDEAIQNFQQGKVRVSFGLLPEMVVDSIYGPGELVPASDQVVVSVRVLGPSWIKANHISLYANGQKIREADFTEENMSGIKWRGTWTLPRPQHDLFLVAIAEGPGTSAPFWPIAKPYQPTSPDWTPRVMGSTGAVWIDADQDGQWTSAYTYAKKLLAASKGDIQEFIKRLSSFDKTVAIQAAALLKEQGWTLKETDLEKALQQAAPSTSAGFKSFMEAWEASKTSN